MTSTTIELQLPDDLREIFASDSEAHAFAFRSLVLELLRDGKIGQGKAAELLGITRWDILGLMASHRIPSGPQTEEEVLAEVAAAQRALEESRQRVGRQ